MEINPGPMLPHARFCWWGDAIPAVDLKGDTLFFSLQVVLPHGAIRSVGRFRYIVKHKTTGLFTTWRRELAVAAPGSAQRTEPLVELFFHENQDQLPPARRKHHKSSS